MGYEIEIVPGAKEELKSLRAYDRARILGEMNRQLKSEPNVETRNRKLLNIVVAGFDFSSPLWELRVGEYRVFYDVDEARRSVLVRAVRSKDTGQKTEDIIQ